jgi:quercetin dioxygenase-like cupin family protein
MNRRLFLRGVSCSWNATSGKKVSVSHTQTATNKEGLGKKVRSHLPSQHAFRAIMDEDMDWKPFAAFPPSVRLAVLVGQPAQEGPYLIRVKVPQGVRLMPHKHPEDRIYTVISGVFYIGLGDQFDPEKLQAYPPGAVIVLPGDTSHFHWARSGGYVTQVSAIGPLGLDYLNPKDDPRNGNSANRDQEK